MLKFFIKWVSSTHLGFMLALKIISSSIRYHRHNLVPEDLEKLGWVLKDSFWSAPDVDDTNKVFVRFWDDFYRVFIGKHKTFFASENSKEWFEVFIILKDWEKRYLLC